VRDLLERYERELLSDPALVEAILSDPVHFPPPPPKPVRVLLRCREAQIDRAIHHGFALAILDGKIPTIELLGESDAANSV
jgi:hypothetical protein